MGGSQLSSQVSQSHFRNPDVGGKQRKDGFVRPASPVQLEPGDSQSLLEDLRIIASGASGQTPSQVCVMSSADRKCHPTIFPEDGADYKDVGYVHAAVEGVVENEHIPGIDFVSVFFQEGPHGKRDRGDVMRECDALGNHLPLPVTQGGGKVQAIPNNGGTGRAVKAERHLVRSRCQSMSHDGQGDRIGFGHRVTLGH